MIDLVRAELLRLLSRRMLRGIVAVVFGLMLIVAIVNFFTSKNDPNSGLEQAQRQVQLCQQQQQFAPPGSPNDGCPTVEQLRPGFDKRFQYTRSMPEGARNVAIPLFMVALLIGASFVGAEWGTGSITTLLTWEPRRGRLLIAKWIATILVCAALVFVALVFLILIFYPVGVFRGVTSGIDGTWWKGVFFTWLRAAALGAVGGTLGVAFATFTRNTAAAAGFGVFFMAIVDPFITFAAFDGKYRRWLFQRNIAEFLGLPVSDPQPDGVFTSSVHAKASAIRAGVLLTIYALAALSIAWGAFRSRDVT